MKKVLVAVDGTKGSKSVLAVFRNSVRPPEEVILLHVEELEGRSLMTGMLGEAEMSTLKEALRGTEHKEALDVRAGKILAYYRREIEDGGLVRVKTVVREGHPSEEILKVAEEEGAELIIMGCGGKKGLLDRLVTGCVSRDVERGASVPVVMAKEASDEEASSWIEAAPEKLIPEKNC
jgi:nucleotide-binding universal stress UspA family protein